MSQPHSTPQRTMALAEGEGPDLHPPAVVGAGANVLLYTPPS